MIFCRAYTQSVCTRGKGINRGSSSKMVTEKSIEEIRRVFNKDWCECKIITRDTFNRRLNKQMWEAQQCGWGKLGEWSEALMAAQAGCVEMLHFLLFMTDSVDLFYQTEVLLFQVRKKKMLVFGCPSVSVKKP